MSIGSRPVAVFAGGVGVPARKWAEVRRLLGGESLDAAPLEVAPLDAAPLDTALLDDASTPPAPGPAPAMGQAPDSGESAARSRSGAADRPIDFIVVDRPGLGRRDPRPVGDVPDFAAEVARIVHDIRRIRGTDAASADAAPADASSADAAPVGPVILVAHSAAGFLAEAAVRSNPGLVDGVLLLDVSVTEEAGAPAPIYERVSQGLGRILDPVASRAVPGVRPGEVSALLAENAAFGRWARDLEEVRAATAQEPATAVGDPIPGDPAPGDPIPGDPTPGNPTSRDAAAPAAHVLAVTDVLAVPKIRRGDVAAVTHDAHPDHLARWAALSATPVAEVVLDPCSHNVMSDRPDAVAAEIRSLVTRVGDVGAGAS